MSASNPSDLPSLRRSLNAKLGELAAARKACRYERSALAEARAALETLRAAQRLAQAVAQRVQEEAHKRIADIVSRSLSVVFQEPYTFKIKFEQKRGRTEASLVFIRDGMEVDPMTASGGGVVDVAAWALRLSCLLLSRPPLRRLLVLDEPFRFLSAEYRGAATALVQSLAEELDCQFIIVTHSEESKAGAIVGL